MDKENKNFYCDKDWIYIHVKYESVKLSQHFDTWNPLCLWWVHVTWVKSKTGIPFYQQVYTDIKAVYEQGGALTARFSPLYYILVQRIALGSRKGYL